MSLSSVLFSHMLVYILQFGKFAGIAIGGTVSINVIIAGYATPSIIFTAGKIYVL